MIDLPIEIKQKIFHYVSRPKIRRLCQTISPLTPKYTQQEIAKISLGLIRNIIKIESELSEIEDKTHRFSDMPRVINPHQTTLKTELKTLTDRLNVFFNLLGDTLDISKTNITDTELETLINVYAHRNKRSTKNS